VEFSSVLVYRLQARAQSIRLRYQDASVTMSGQLALNGTSDASTVSGLMTLNRASVDPRADLGQLMATFAKPSAAPSSNDYLRGMQFDVHIESEPNFQFQTSLTRDVETEVDLRLRGTPQRMALLGSVSVDQGEIELFGNRYTIDRGQISFLSPVKIEPSFDLNLETRVRGITVNVAIAGTMQRLNVNYSSDPPLQSREIVALLAVGRTPSESAGLTAPQDTSGSSNFAEAGGGVLSEAVTEQLSGRLQRFFGASRVKIDPTVTGIDYLPAARLTLQQQVSHDVTLTYITNLNRTEEQIVQVEWDFSQHWSAVAVREANGLFGLDIQYKKRFK
jgi:translocation and assembly module TamB